MTDTEELGKGLQKLGCAGMSTGCILTLLSPFIIIGIIILLPIAFNVVLPLLVLLLPVILITRSKYKKLAVEYPNKEDRAERWKKANRQAWKPTLIVYGSALLFVLVASLFLPEQGPVTSTVTRESAAGYSGLAESSTRTLGTWRVTYQGVNITTSIRQEDGDYYMEQYLVFRGSGNRIEERLTKRGDRYYLNNSEYFVIDTGYLEAYDSSGFIWAAR
ncbi:MAG: hypothetical protein F4X59_18170 [Holophagales bacterium]|nr:hypothetical protein [Holophagales bacterium]MYC12031.1 hypothetical protein [Holophagales bacterium]